MKITVQGYQSIKGPATIEIAGFTVLTGESNIGKSAFVRAYIGLTTNQKGNAYQRKDTDLEVKAENEGQRVIWRRTGKSAEYVINDQVYRKTGRSTPNEEIAKLGIFPITAQERPYYPQIQKQFATPFIIGDVSPTAAAELIAASKYAGALAKAIKLAQKDSHEVEDKLEILENDLKEQKTTAEKLRLPLSALEEKERELLLQEGQKNQHQERTNTLRNYQTQLRECQQKSSGRVPEGLRNPPKPTENPQYREILQEKKKLVTVINNPFSAKERPLPEVPSLQTHQNQLRKEAIHFQKILQQRIGGEIPIPVLLSPELKRTKILLREYEGQQEKNLIEQTEIKIEMQRVIEEEEELRVKMTICETCGQVLPRKENAPAGSTH